LMQLPPQKIAEPLIGEEKSTLHVLSEDEQGETFKQGEIQSVRKSVGSLRKLRFALGRVSGICLMHGNLVSRRNAGIDSIPSAAGTWADRCSRNEVQDEIQGKRSSDGPAIPRYSPYIFTSTAVSVQPQYCVPTGLEPRGRFREGTERLSRVEEAKTSPGEIQSIIAGAVESRPLDSGLRFFA
jgi:hypothetical protein